MDSIPADNIDEDLTPELAYESCLEWVRDIPKEEYEKNKTDRTQFFGQPQKPDKNLVGVYRVVKFLPIDYTLNPNNAPERGYEWIADVYYSPDAPKEINAEAFEDYDNGYLFGEAASVAIMENGFVGKYQKISNNE